VIDGTLRPDLVLIAVPPKVERVQRGVLRLAPARELFQRVGVVVQVGARVTEVQPKDRVVFDAEAAEEIDGMRWPCVLVPETAIAAVVE